MKYLFRENNNEVKVNKVLDLYRKLLNETNNRSKCIMLIVPNATSKLNYERELNIDISEELIRLMSKEMLMGIFKILLVQIEVLQIV